jgi:hypothetical protein
MPYFCHSVRFNAHIVGQLPMSSETLVDSSETLAESSETLAEGHSGG